MQKIQKLTVAANTSPPVPTTAESILNAAKHLLTPLQMSLFRAQLFRNKSQRRWSMKDKLFALQLRYKSAAAFRFVSRHLKLPSESTLRRFVSAAVGRVDSGFTCVMFKLLSLRVSGLPTCERQCALVFDDMSLSCLLSYDKNLDRVIGYADDGTIATHALVFMVRGIKTKWKQAVAFFFTPLPRQH